MKLKNFMCIVVAFALFLSAYPVYSSVADNKTGNFGESISWTLTGNTLTLSGKGVTYSFESESSSALLPDRSVISRVRNLVIEDGITGIGSCSFKEFYNLEEVKFPKSLETIGDNAFWGTRISELIFPEESLLKSIGKEAFKSCRNMEKADLSNCVYLEKIGEYTFCYCSELSSVIFPEECVLSEISTGTFWGCNEIVSVLIPESVKTIGEYAFYGLWDLHYVRIPGATEKIAGNAFSGAFPLIFTPAGTYAQNYASVNNLMYSNLPYDTPVVIREGTLSNGIKWSYTTDGTLTISGNGAIEDFPSSPYAPWYRLGNSGLKNLVISDGITHIGRENFAQFKTLKTVTLPSTLKTIGKYAFIGCSGIEKMILPEGFAGLGECAVYSCSSLKELVIPSSMYIINDWALYGLDSVEKYTVSKSNMAFSSDENGVLYNGDKTVLIKYPAASCAKSYTIPASVKEIQPNAFDMCKTLEKLNFEENSNLKSIGYNSFSNSAIREINLPYGIEFIGEAAFDNCIYLESITLPETVTEIKDSAFGQTGLKSIIIPGSISVIGNNAFSGCSKLEKIEFSEGLTAIGANAFNGCSNLKEIALPKSLSWIDPKTLNSYSDSLEIITFPNGNPFYSTDEYGAVYYCSVELVWYPKHSENKSYIIPNGVTRIYGDVFEGTENLEEVILPSTISKIEFGTFRSCKSLKTITIPKEITEIEAEAFRNCISLSDVNFEDGTQISKIGVRAFHGCKNLKEFTVPDTIVTIGNSTFGSCTYLEKVTFSANSEIESLTPDLFTGSHFVTVYAPQGSVAGEYAKKHRIHIPLIVNVNGKPVSSDVLPFIVNSRTMIPMRTVFEALDAKVEWNEEKRTVKAVKKETTVELTVGSNVIVVNGIEHDIDSSSFIFEGRTMIPLRAVSEAFGYDVGYNHETKTVDITGK